jgi:hypothetical protein
VWGGVSWNGGTGLLLGVGWTWTPQVR